MHIKNFTLPGDLVGKGILAVAKQALGKEIAINEYYKSLLKAGFTSELALSFVMEKSSYPSWVAYKAPSEEELKKYLDEEDDD